MVFSVLLIFFALTPRLIPTAFRARFRRKNINAKFFENDFQVFVRGRAPAKQTQALRQFREVALCFKPIITPTADLPV